MDIAQIKLTGLAKRNVIEEEIVVGKDVLELVAGAMYADPLTIYREYVQNAADALDEARALARPASVDEPHISITLDHIERTVKIRDMGVGVPAADFARRLTAIGASRKRGKSQRGFRGVGRLSGLGYCQELIFRSRALGESKIKELRWDVRALREKLRDPSFTGSLADLIRSVASVANVHDDGAYPSHFFEVEMRKVLRIKNDLLMNEDEIRDYLSQVAPVPFSPEFRFGEEIHRWLSNRGLSDPVRIELNDSRGIIYHRARDQVQIGKHATVTFTGVEFHELHSSSGEVLGYGWLLGHAYIGAMARSSKMGGIRLRMRDIQVGDSQVLAPLFVESRFCAWSVGEIHVAHPKIVPNARRDEFEHSAAYAELQDELRRLTSNISQTIRSRSEERQRSKRVSLSIAYAENWLDIARRKSLHETIRHAALQQATEHSKVLDEHRAKMQPDPESTAAAEKIQLQIRRLANSLGKKRDPGRWTIGTSRSAVAAVSAILSSTIHSHKAIPMAERVLAAMEGRLDERAT